MPSPAKKRKLDNGDQKTPARGLEYFFSKQRQGAPSTSGGNVANTPPTGDHELTDEELARKLQAEWDLEAANAGATSEAQPQPLHEPPTTATLATRQAAQPSSSLQNDAQTSTSQDATPPSTCKKGAQNGAGFLSLQSVASAVDTVSESIPLDESPLIFDPSEWVPRLKDHWASEEGNASYGLLTRCFVLVNSTQSRIKIVDTLVNCLRVLIEADPASLLPAVWLTTNAISPPYISLELGLGGSALSKALKQVCGLDGRSLKALYNRHGDAGDVAFEAKKKQSFTLRKPKPLTIKGVYGTLVKIAGSQGPGSAEAKQRLVDRLLQDAHGGEESRYVVRTLCQHLRIGAVKTTMLIALSRAFLLSRPTGADFPLRPQDELRRLRKDELAEVWGRAEETVKACFARRPNYNDLVPRLLEVGVGDELLARSDLTLHIPLRPMLGSITRDLGEMLTKLQGRDFACEFKYDGQRAQVHCDDEGRVSIFSRHLELMTDKYPDLVALVPDIRGDGVRSFVMEGEVVAVDSQTGELRNFQTLTNRARKDVDLGSITIQVCLFAFDLMYLNGQSLLARPFRERRELLRSLFVEVPRRFTWVRSLDASSNESETVQAFFKAATESKCEGIMVKILDNLPNPNLSGTSTEGKSTTSATAADGDGDGEASEVASTTTPYATTTATAKTKAASRSKTAAATKSDGGKAQTSSRRKPLLATYEPDKRLDSWLKVKKDYDSSASDTLDLVPVAGWHGQGRKSKWWSPILLAVRDADSSPFSSDDNGGSGGGLQVVCKCISGFTDAFYKANRAFYSIQEDHDHDDPDYDNDNDSHNDDSNNTTKRTPALNTLPSKPPYISYPSSAPQPDVWFQPREVWEVAFADVTLSPTYLAAGDRLPDELLGGHHRGLSLRFPRFLRVRSGAVGGTGGGGKGKADDGEEGEEGEEGGEEQGDKSLEEASDADVLAALWWKQEARGKKVQDEGGNANAKSGGGAEDGRGRGRGREREVRGTMRVECLLGDG